MNEYNKYIRSKWWARRRKVALERHENKCQICLATTKLTVHHKTYERNGKSVLYGEKDTELTVLCGRCHGKWHKYHGRMATINVYLKRARMLLENGCTVDESIRFCFDKKLTNWILGVKRRGLEEMLELIGPHNNRRRWRA